jgi:hypothetical protein
MKNIKYIECGCCGCFHREDFGGDCQDDSERWTYQELLEYGISPNEIIEFDSNWR